MGGRGNKKGKLGFMEMATGRNTLKYASLSKFEKAIIFLCFLLIIAHFVASFFPEQRLWGINHLVYFPLPYRILFSLLALLIFIPKINYKVQDILHRIFESSKEIKNVASFVLICGGSLFVFWLLRTETHFLGDGDRLIAYLDSGLPLTMRLIVHEWMQPLAALVHAYSHKFLNLFIPVDGELIYRISSYISGILFVCLAFLFSKEVGRSKFERLLGFSLVMTLGSTQLFFGYVEHYSWLYVGIFAYLLFSLKFLKGQTSVIFPVLIFCISVGFHFAAFYLLPSLIFLLFSTPRAKRLQRRIIFLGVCGTAMTLIFLLFELDKKLGDIFLPLFEAAYDAPHHTLFSFPHILDVINEHLLLCPLGLVLFTIVFIFLRSDVGAKDRVVTFLILVAAFQLLYSFLIDPKLGAPRDWDMFSATALGYTVLAIYLLTRYSKAILNFKYISLILLSTALFSTLPWILLNAGTERSIERFRTVLELDPGRSRQGRYLLAQYFWQRGMRQECAREYTMEKELFPEVGWVNSAITCIENGKTDDAVELLKQAIERNPHYASAYYNLGVAYTHKRLLDEASRMMNRAIEIFPYKAAYYEGLGSVYRMMGRLDESIESYKKAGKFHPEDPSMHFYRLGACYAAKGLLDEAVRCYKKSVEENPNFAEGYCDMGDVYLRMREIDEAVTSFEKALNIRSDNPRAHYGLGAALVKKGVGKEAKEHLEHYLDLSTDTTDHWRVRSLLESLKRR